MPRNLDLTALRSFVAVAETGGVTKAAGFLHLTQSAVSMQIKRLEEALGLPLLDRAGRGVALTAAGEQLLGYARRMMALNDEVWSRLTAQEYEGEISLGVPHDIVQPILPGVLRRFAQEHPRVRIVLQSSFTRRLKALHARGDCDVILTTEEEVDPGAAALTKLPLVWVGAPEGRAWRARPLDIAFEDNCIFRPDVTSRLDAAGIPWRMAVETDNMRTVGAMVSADLAVHAMLEGTRMAGLETIRHGGALPDLPVKTIGLYLPGTGADAPVRDLGALLREAYAAM